MYSASRLFSPRCQELADFFPGEFWDAVFIQRSLVVEAPRASVEMDGIDIGFGIAVLPECDSCVAFHRENALEGFEQIPCLMFFTPAALAVVPEHGACSDFTD